MIPFGQGIAGLAVSLALLAGPALAAPKPDLKPLRFADMAGWAADDHGAALATFRTSCAGVSTGALADACTAARVGSSEARAFFETWFEPVLVWGAGKGFFTGYFEPEYRGSAKRTTQHSTPLLGMPRVLPSPAPDRSAIEAGALRDIAPPLVWLDPIDAFFVHIQGSARIRLDDGTVVRVAFAGRNGLPFTPVGRILVERGALTLDQVSMQTIRDWMLRNPAEAPALMRANRSFIFFRLDRRSGNEGPVGAQAVPLTAGRSLAVDRAYWTLGLPVWVSTVLPGPAARPFRRLMVAQDTGAAIKGPARGDVYLGTGAEAGEIAGLMKQTGDFIVLQPRKAPRR